MAYVKPKYEGEDFLKWYKTHYGKDYDGSTLNRSDGMQDQDWEIGNALYGTYKDRLAREEQYNNDKNLLEKGYGDAQSVADKTYNTQKDSLVGEYNKNQAELLKNYQSSASSLEKSKNQSLQSASITYDKLKKYLPTQIKAQGLGGLGVSESTMLQAHNNYAAQTGDIKNQYNANKTALEENYGTNKASLETAHENNIATLENQKLASDTERKTTLDQSLADLLTYYNSDMQGLKTDVGAITQKFFNQNKELQQGNYEDLASLISGDLKTEDLETFIQRIDSADIDDNQKALLKTLATNQVNNNITTRQNSTFENFKNVIANLKDTSIENIVNAIGQIFGIPTRNVYNFLYGITNRISPSTGYLIDNAFYNQNYSSDLAKAIEHEDEDMIATIVGIMLNERVGSIQDSKTQKELNALVVKGYEVLPKSIGKTIAYNGEEITLTSKQKEQFKKVYSKANETLASLVEGKYYESATDEVRAKAIKFIYDIYYNLAIEDLLGVDLETKNILFAKAVDIPSLAIIVATARELESDKDKSGKTISGSKKAKVQSYINSLKLNATQKYMIMGYLGYTNKYGALQVKRYIQSLSLTTSQKELLYEYSGYKN